LASDFVTHHYPKICAPKRFIPGVVARAAAPRQRSSLPTIGANGLPYCGANFFASVCRELATRYVLMIPRCFLLIANERRRGVVQNCNTPGKENPMSIQVAAIVGLFFLIIGFLLYFGTKARLPISM
jgi:hypothetical protein